MMDPDAVYWKVIDRLEAYITRQVARREPAAVMTPEQAEKWANKAVEIEYAIDLAPPAAVLVGRRVYALLRTYFQNYSPDYKMKVNDVPVYSTSELDLDAIEVYGRPWA